MASRRLLVFLPILAWLAACGDDSNLDGDGGSESDTDSGESDEVGTESSDSADTDATDTDDSDATDSTDATDTDGGCVPAGDAFVAFDLVDVDPNESLDWSMTCTVSDFGPADGESGSLVALANCTSLGSQPVPSDLELFFDSSPSSEPLLQLDATVQLRWVQEPPFIAGRWFTLRTETGDTLLLGGIDGSSVLPPDAPDFDFDGVSVAFVDGGCDPVPVDCAAEERWSLELGWDGVTSVIADSNFDYVGQIVSYRGIVDSALSYSRIDCDDFPSARILALLVLIPEG